MRMTIKPEIPTPLFNLAVSIGIVSLAFYGFVSMPSGLAEPDVLFWIYAKSRVATSLSEWGEKFGLGHSASLYRSLVSALRDPPGRNHTLHRGMNVTDTIWQGVQVRIYEPPNKVRNGPAIVFYHSGLWIMGSLDDHEQIACQLSLQLGVILIAVDYRLAPEHPYPAGLDDCYNIAEYLLRYGHIVLGIDRHMIILTGIGAGGNLAAAVALKLRDNVADIPRPLYQVLINPLLQPLDLLTPSYRQNEHDASFPKSLVIKAWLWYGLGMGASTAHSSALDGNRHTSSAVKQSKLADRVSHNLIHRKYIDQAYAPNAAGYGDDEVWAELGTLFSDPYFAPLLADNLRDLPAAYIVAAHYDVVRDDALMYAKRLEKASVRVHLAEYDKAIHSHSLMTSSTELGRHIMADLIKYLLVNI